MRIYGHWNATGAIGVYGLCVLIRAIIVGPIVLVHKALKYIWPAYRLACKDFAKAKEIMKADWDSKINQ